MRESERNGFLVGGKELSRTRGSFKMFRKVNINCITELLQTCDKKPITQSANCLAVFFLSGLIQFLSC